MPPQSASVHQGLGEMASFTAENQLRRLKVVA